MQLSRNIFILLLTVSILIQCKKEKSNEIGSIPCNVPDIEKMLIDNSNKLGFDCFRQLSLIISPDENLLISPFGISLSLNALLQASHNRTNVEIKNCMFLNNLQDSNINKGYNHLNKLYSEIDENSKLLNSCKIAFDENILLEPESKTFYDNIKYVKIIQDENAGFIEHNDEKSTMQDDGHFQMLNSFDLDANIKYQVRVEESPFYKSPNESSFVEMIVSKSQFNYYSDQTVQVVELPLGRGNFNLLIIFPQNYESVNNLCNRLNNRILEKIKKKFKPQLLEVIMPKLELSGINSIKEIFNNRITSAFKNRLADFTKFSKQGNFYMHDFEHNINLKIHSKVSEQTDIPPSSIDQDKGESILIDHPFIFIIYEKYSEGIICMGKISSI